MKNMQITIVNIIYALIGTLIGYNIRRYIKLQKKGEYYEIVKVKEAKIEKENKEEN